MKKVLLDENLPRLLGEMFSEKFDEKTVPQMDWATKKNGELLQAMMEESFDILSTADKNLPYQQNLSRYGIKVVVPRVYDNRYKTLKNHIETIEKGMLEFPEANSVLEIDLRN